MDRMTSRLQAALSDAQAGSPVCVTIKPVVESSKG
jgi:hypothetical protein